MAVLTVQSVEYLISLEDGRHLVCIMNMEICYRRKGERRKKGETEGTAMTRDRFERNTTIILSMLSSLASFPAAAYTTHLLLPGGVQRSLDFGDTNTICNQRRNMRTVCASSAIEDIPDLLLLLLLLATRVYYPLPRTSKHEPRPRKESD